MKKIILGIILLTNIAFGYNMDDLLRYSNKLEAVKYRFVYGERFDEWDDYQNLRLKIEMHTGILIQFKMSYIQLHKYLSQERLDISDRDFKEFEYKLDEIMKDYKIEDIYN